MKVEQIAPEGATCRYQLLSKSKSAMTDIGAFIIPPVRSISKIEPETTDTLYQSPKQ